MATTHEATVNHGIASRSGVTLASAKLAHASTATPIHHAKKSSSAMRLHAVAVMTRSTADPTPIATMETAIHNAASVSTRRPTPASRPPPTDSKEQGADANGRRALARCARSARVARRNVRPRYP